MSLLFPKDKSINLLHPEAQKMFHRLVETIQSGIFMTDTGGKLFYVNSAFVNILGHLKKDDVLGQDLSELLFSDPAQRNEFPDKMKAFGLIRDWEVKTRSHDGFDKVLLLTVNYIYDDAGKVVGREGVVRDITEKNNLEEALLIEKQKLEKILRFDEEISAIHEFDALAEFVAEHAVRILEARRSSLMLLDTKTNELHIQSSRGLTDECLKEPFVKLGESVAGTVAQEGRPYLVRNIEYDEKFKRANRVSYKGRSFMSVPIKERGRVIGVINVADKFSKEPEEQVFTEIDLKILCAIAREVAVALVNVQAYKELESLTITDPLTHIYNYRQFAKSLEYELKRLGRVKTPLSLIMMDVDDFKQYNDQYGHLEGDNLLKSIGKILKDQLRETDIVCRYAGDEFAIILPGVDIKGARNAAEKIRSAVEKYPLKRKVTVSQGIAAYETKMTRYELTLRADRALYQSKKAGKNGISVYS